MSYVFLPRSISNGCPICSVMTFPIKSSKYPTDHPPYLKPPLSSSPGPPGACITPSSVMNDKTMSFLMSAPPCLLAADAYPDYGMVENSSAAPLSEFASRRRRREVIDRDASDRRCREVLLHPGADLGGGAAGTR